MVDSSCEGDLWWLEWIISWEMNVQEVDSTGIWRVIWAHDGCLPVELILLVKWSGRAVGGWVLSKVD